MTMINFNSYAVVEIDDNRIVAISEHETFAAALSPRSLAEQARPGSLIGIANAHHIQLQVGNGLWTIYVHWDGSFHADHSSLCGPWTGERDHIGPFASIRTAIAAIRAWQAPEQTEEAAA